MSSSGTQPAGPSDYQSPAGGGATWWRPLATVAVFSVLPFAGFLNANRLETQLDATLASYVLLLLLPGVAVVVAVGVRRGAVAAERAAVLFAVGSFLFFRFEPVHDAAEALGGRPGRGTLAVWVVVFAIGLLIALRLSRHRLTWTYALVAGALMTAIPIAEYTHFRATDKGATELRSSTLRPSTLLPTSERPTPDVYFFLLDAYGRADQLDAVLDEDNGPFLDQLRARGFAVNDGAVAPYTMTYLTMAAIFTMDYPVTDGRASDVTPYFEVLLGTNPVVAFFKQLGYEFAVTTDWQSPELVCTDKMDLCPTQHGAIGEREWALLSATPLVTVLPQFGIRGGGRALVLPPDDAVQGIEEGRGDEPVFAYIHLLAPHSPYAYTQDCQLRETPTAEAEPGDDADSTAAHGYITKLRCTNASLLRAIDWIVANNPSAMIVLSGDHGPGFGFDLTEPVSTWPDAGLRQRLAILSAARLPGCTQDGAARNAVNVFRIVISCVSSQEIDLLPSRQFAAPYDQVREVVPVPPG